MTREEAIQYFAKKVVTNGNCKKGRGCLIPSDYANTNDPEGDYSKASDILVEEFDATHYDHEWIDYRKGLVRLTLYRGDSFGACLEVKKIQELEVTI
jgi:hypothetical protein